MDERLQSPEVSNQLISLTSREQRNFNIPTGGYKVSNQLISLTSRESSHFKPIRHRLSRSGLRGSEISSAETTFYSLIKTLEPIPRGIARLPTTESALQRFYLSLAEKIK